MNNSLLYFPCMEKKMIWLVEICTRVHTSKGAKGYAIDVAFKKPRKRVCTLKFSGSVAIPLLSSRLGITSKMQLSQRLLYIVVAMLLEIFKRLSKQKSVSPSLHNVHRKKIPAVDTVKCCCPI